MICQEALTLCHKMLGWRNQLWEIQIYIEHVRNVISTGGNLYLVKCIVDKAISFRILKDSSIMGLKCRWWKENENQKNQ